MNNFVFYFQAFLQSENNFIDIYTEKTEKKMDNFKCI